MTGSSRHFFTMRLHTILVHFKNLPLFPPIKYMVMKQMENSTQCPYCLVAALPSIPEDVPFVAAAMQVCKQM